MYYFIYRNDDISDSKHHICATSVRLIRLSKRLNREWNHVYMDNLYNNVKLFRDAYVENKPLHGVDRTHGQVVPEEIIQ